MAYFISGHNQILQAKILCHYLNNGKGAPGVPLSRYGVICGLRPANAPPLSIGVACNHGYADLREALERGLPCAPSFPLFKWEVFVFHFFDGVPSEETLARLRDRPYPEVKNQIAFLIWRPTAEEIQIR